jgi:hypothetical protein
MNSVIKFVLLVLLPAGLLASVNNKLFVKVVQDLSGNDTISINRSIAVVNNYSGDGGKALMGALLMKKSGLVKGVAEKYRMFKEGRDLLENEIKSDPDNCQFRLLRLMIQENCPLFLGYYSNREQDAAFIRKSFGLQADEIKDIIRSYSKKSSYLNIQEIE